MSSTLLDHESSISVTTGAHDEGERPKVRGPPLAQFQRGHQVLKVPQSENPASPIVCPIAIWAFFPTDCSQLDPKFEMRACACAFVSLLSYVSLVAHGVHVMAPPPTGLIAGALKCCGAGLSANQYHCH